MNSRLSLSILVMFTLAPMGAWGQEPAQRVRDLIASGKIKEAKDALFTCAEAQKPSCQFLLAQLVERGELYVRDLKTAKQLYELAYRSGHAEAGPEILRLAKLIDPESDSGPTSSPTKPEKVAQQQAPGTSQIDASAPVRSPSIPVTPKPSRAISCSPQSTGFRDGVRTVVVDCGVVVEVAALAQEKSKALIGVAFTNRTDLPMRAGPELLEIRQGTQLGTIYTREQATNVMSRAATGRSIGATIASIFDAIGTGATAGRTRETGMFQGSTNHGSTFSGSYTAIGRDSTAHRNAMQGVYARNEAMQAGVNEQRAAIGEMERQYLFDTYIHPGQTLQGVVLAELPQSSGWIEVTVSVNGAKGQLFLTGPK